MGPEVDTIAAVSTARGPSGLSVVRVSGPAAQDVLRALTTEGASIPEPRVACVREIRSPSDGRVLDRAVVTRYAAPASYTGEALVEISCHGGYLVPALVLEACLAAGAREAEPGEFTRRAYLNGKLDLLQVEAVADVIEARSEAEHRAVMGHLERGLSRRIEELREGLVHLEALLVHHIDFPEEDDAPVPLENIVSEADGVRRKMEALLKTAPEGELLRAGALAVLAGRPNVGKSSLYNALLGEERAIVTEVPGTTRDALEAHVQLGGFPFRLMDTAGIREEGDRIERMGIEVTRRYLAEADLVLFCVESGSEPTAEEHAFLAGDHRAPVVVVETKIDLPAREVTGPGMPEAGTPGAGAEGSAVLGSGMVAGRAAVSVVTGEGLGELRELLPALVFSGLVTSGADAPVLTRRRQAAGVKEALSEVGAFAEALGNGVPPEAAATHLRGAATALEEVLGVISMEDVLDAVFRDFCIGK